MNRRGGGRARRTPRSLAGGMGSLLIGCLLCARADEPWEVAGFYKNLLSVTDVSDNYRNLGLTRQETAWDDYQRVRLKGDASPTDHLNLRVHYELRLVWGETERIRRRLEAQTPDAPGRALFPETNRPRFLDLDHELHRGDASTVQHGLDRLEAAWVAETWDLTVGRQAVSWGVGRIWTPNDLFAGFAPNEIDRDEKPGVDVVRLRWFPTLHSSLDLVAEPLDEDGPYDVDADESSLALRATTHLGEYDLAALGGRIAGDGIAGVDVSGYLGNAGLRAEALYTRVKEADQRDYARVLLSLDYGFAMPWNPYLAVEYFYNGLGTTDRQDYLPRLATSSVQRAFSRGNAFNIGRHYAGAIFSVAPTALWSLQFITLVNLTDGSVLEYAAATRSLRDNLDLLLGLNTAFGPPGTEFGGFSTEQAGVEFTTPDFGFAFLKWYF